MTKSNKGGHMMKTIALLAILGTAVFAVNTEKNDTKNVKKTIKVVTESEGTKILKKEIKTTNKIYPRGSIATH